MDPKISLAIDNCFASKRWTRPGEWMRVVKEIGLTNIEASADTECDPLYLGKDFTADWIREVRQQSRETGCVVKNLYSGHGTYATSGLSHYDRRVIERFRDGWMKAQMDTARELGAGFGFFAHGFADELLQDDSQYNEKLDELYDTLADIAVYARQIGMACVGIEQMYSPHQPPWRLKDMSQLFKEVYKRADAPFYTTLDLGHMNGQQYFEKPNTDLIEGWIYNARQGSKRRGVWLGSENAYKIYNNAIDGTVGIKKAAELIMLDIDKHPHLFSEACDWTMGEWLRRFGCYSPIIHLQQTDGKSSPHWPFSPEYNKKGVVSAEAVLKALSLSYAQPYDPAMPPKCDEIVLTLEPFIGTAGNTFDLREELTLSVDYWRCRIPRDNMPLSEIIERMNTEN